MHFFMCTPSPQKDERVRFPFFFELIFLVFLLIRWEVGQLLWDTHQVIQVNCAAKCKNQLFYKFNGRGVVRFEGWWGALGLWGSSAPRERNGHLNSNRKTFPHIQVTLKCA